MRLNEMLNLNQIIRAIRKLVMSPIEGLQDTTKRFSEPLTIDLSEARNQKEYQVYGDVMIVEDLDGIATVYLNNKEGSPHTLRIGRKIYQDFWRFFITNVAQAGKTLKIVVGREGCFDITDTDYWINLLKDKSDDVKEAVNTVKIGIDGLDGKVDGVISASGLVKSAVDTVKNGIDGLDGKVDGVITATIFVETAVDLVKGVVDGIKVGTDKIIADGATGAKQDLMKTAIDGVKTGTNKIIADGATEAKQDDIISKQTKLLAVVPSENLLLSNDDVKTYAKAGAGEWAKKKENAVLRDGMYRIKFSAKRTSGIYLGKAAIYRNGVEVLNTGDLNDDYTLYTYNLPFQAGDLLQIYLYAEQSYMTSIKELRMYGDETGAIGMVIM